MASYLYPLNIWGSRGSLVLSGDDSRRLSGFLKSRSLYNSPLFRSSLIGVWGQCWTAGKQTKFLEVESIGMPSRMSRCDTSVRRNQSRPSACKRLILNRYFLGFSVQRRSAQSVEVTIANQGRIYRLKNGHLRVLGMSSPAIDSPDVGRPESSHLSDLAVTWSREPRDLSMLELKSPSLSLNRGISPN